MRRQKGATVTMCHSDNNWLFVKGNQYSVNATHIPEIIEAEQREGREPLVIVETAGAIVVVAEQDFNPLLAKIIKGHLAGKWVMLMEPEARYEGRQISPRVEQRLKEVLEVLPIGWGEQPTKCAKLGISQRELGWALKELARRNLAFSPKQGVWVKSPQSIEG